MLYTTILILHVAGGTISLLSGTLNMILKKGNNLHRLIGLVFFYAMLTTAISALLLSALKPSFFLFIIGVFTFYLVVTGARYPKLRSLLQHQKPVVLDFIVVYGMLSFGLTFVAYGIYRIITSDDGGITLCVFGVISLILVRKDLRLFSGKTGDTNYWLLEHITRMVAAYIAAFTAFLVVNNTNLPGVVAWLLPTVIGTPLIASWVRKHRIKRIHITNQEA